MHVTLFTCSLEANMATRSLTASGPFDISESCTSKSWEGETPAGGPMLTKVILYS